MRRAGIVAPQPRYAAHVERRMWNYIRLLGSAVDCLKFLTL